MKESAGNDTQKVEVMKLLAGNDAQKVDGRIDGK